MVFRYDQPAQRQRRQWQRQIARLKLTHAHLLATATPDRRRPEIGNELTARRTDSDFQACLIDPIPVAIAITPGPPPVAQIRARVFRRGNEFEEPWLQSQLCALVVEGQSAGLGVWWRADVPPLTQLRAGDRAPRPVVASQQEMKPRSVSVHV